MGKYKHHSGSVGGGVNLSKGKTPHDSLMKYMPVDNKASGLFKMKQPFEMGKSMRGPLDRHMSQDHKMAYDRSEISRLKKDIHYDDLKKHDSKGFSKLDPMYNGKPGVQKEDFNQFKSKGPEKKDPKKAMIQGAAEAVNETAAQLAQNQDKKKKMMKEVKKLPRKKA